MKGKVQCTCGWSWNKSDSSKKDMYICHECGRDNSNNMKNGGWLDNYGTQENYNDYKVSAPEGMVGDGFSNVGRNYSPAWGGQFQEGGIIPMAQTGMATRADSLAVYNSAKAIEDYYKKQGYIKQKIKDTKKHKDAEKFAKSWINNAQKFLNDAKKQPLIPGLVTQASKNKKIAELKGYLNSAQKSLSKTRDEVNPKKYIQNLNESKKSFEKKLKDVGTYVDEQGNFIEGKPSAEKFYSPIDENKFYQREQSHGFLDLRSPMPLYDERITPQDLSQYRSPNLIKKDELENLLQKTTNKKEKESIQKQIDNLINTDNVELYEYDPLAVMPFDMIPPEQQEERVRKYGISGVPKSVLDLHPEWLSSVAKTDAVSIQDSAQVSRPNLETANITPAGMNLELSPNLNIIQQARTPKYFKVTDRVNQSFGGTETNYEVYPDQDFPSMSTQTYPDGTPMNTRIITPVYQQGGSIPGSVGFTYARTKGIPSEGPYAKKTMPSAQNGQEMRFYQEGLDFKPKTISREGSVIKDDLGQWAHPGEITEIDSPYITMKGVPYPVLGISDTGDVQIMYPEEEYEFDGEKVTEYPMAKNGLRQEQKGLVNLDNLLNFTNYNTKQPGGWLDTL